ncbi:nuclear transport factor 2 family protein [Ruegeria sp. HKCCD4884]|uniref:nuclear transport factor 2 family protein n=1 Tax=Ruegeria sp. HKCCD4884 TaxID=2683022 RepID=UPI0014916013|nr:ester cyclase [Ruegeria sp. HKCCD4884]NOD93692.1 nuclear transport factor 2 family protein [Ruegeria sp. HKCCD4884]
MKGFDPKFKDFPDYIIGITKEIWEDRGIATLHHYYSPDIVVRSPASVVLGNQNVIGATMATLAEFPDRQLLGEDVIWSGTPEEGMLSSHRIISTATHLADGVYGKATGKQLRYRILADCHAIDNQINDEWLIRDQGAIVRQMGWDPKEYAADLIAREGGPENCVKPLTPATDQPGPYKGNGNDNEWGQRYADILTRIMSADMGVIEAEYDRAVQSEYVGGVTGHGWDSVDRFWMGLRASFPNAEFKIEHQIGRDDPNMAPRAAVRWSLHGKHDGWGVFGVPTGAEVYVLGISHGEFGELISGHPQLRREYTLFDETSVWKQILLQTGGK